MANIFGAPKATEESRSVPKGDTVGSYTSYLDAQKAVDYLADQQFPVQHVSIVGNDLKMVERVTGRLSYPRVALSGALSGMWFGLFVGVMLSFFTPAGGPFSIVTSVLMGAAFFMLFGIVTYAAQRGKRDFTSTSQVVATNYDVIVALGGIPRSPPSPSPVADESFRGGFRPAAAGIHAAGLPEPAGPSRCTTGPGPGTSGVLAGPLWPAWTRSRTGNGRRARPACRGCPGSAAARPTAGVRYPDLPDGRPQYGVRVNEPGNGEQAGNGEDPAKQ